MAKIEKGSNPIKGLNLFDELIRKRDQYRDNVKQATMVNDGEKLSLEKNRMGLYRWYLHPSLEKQAIRTQLVWIQ